MPRSDIHPDHRPTSPEKEWRPAPGRVARRPKPPAGLGAAGGTWWVRAWASDVSAGWTDMDRLRCERAARLADAIDVPKPSAASSAELRQIESSLALDAQGRRAQRILPADHGKKAASAGVEWPPKDPAARARRAERAAEARDLAALVAASEAK